jgi:hypothetical protein
MDVVPSPFYLFSFLGVVPLIWSKGATETERGRGPMSERSSLPGTPGVKQGKQTVVRAFQIPIDAPPLDEVN